MSTAPAPTLESHDDRGLSIVTSTMTTADPRRGTLYRPDTLATGMPIYYHPLQNGNYLALFAFRWVNTTPGSTGPQSYATHTKSDAPCSVEVDVVSGRVGAVTDLPVPATRTLTGACGRNNIFWTIGQDTAGNGVIGMYRVTESRGVLLDTEEILPPVYGVTFSKGCLLDGTHLIVFGTDSAHNVYAARKNWARIGTPDAADGAWSYSCSKGWDTPWTEMVQSDADPELEEVEHHPLQDPLAPLGPTSQGPVSAATRWGRVWLSTVDNAAGVRTAKVWTGRTLRSCQPTTTTVVALGGTSSYLGGGLHFQPQVNASQVMSETPAIPYTISVLGASGQSINNDWGLHFLV